jgi:hypothetical protein
MTDIYILTYSHRHGTDLFPYTTMELANLAKSKMVTEAYAEAFSENPDEFSMSDMEEKLAEVEEFFEIGTYPLLNSLD